MLLLNVDFIHIHTIFEPPLLVWNFDVIAAHLPLAHTTVFCKSPVLEAVRSPPLSSGIVPFIPELYSNLGPLLAILGCEVSS